jgi:Zn-dependent protease
MELSVAEKFSMFLVLLVSLAFHEFAHAWSAVAMGDSTPRLQGRLTLNPLAHIDLIGTVVLPLVMIMLAPGFVLFGWGRPVMFDPRNFKKPVLGECLTTLAGPLANVLLALLTAIGLGFWLGHTSDAAVAHKITSLGMSVIYMNALLAVFNLIPIPPLDGSHVMRHLTGMSELQFIRLAQWGGWVLLLLINIPFFQNLLSALISWVASPILLLMALLAGA